MCGICRMPFEACCPGVKYPGDDCPPVWGKCGHAFHMQCVMKWLESQQNIYAKNVLCAYKHGGSEKVKKIGVISLWIMELNCE